MSWEITVANYRAISEEAPLKIDFTVPVTSLLGPNNSGKTSTLKFFWEFWDLLSKAPSSLMTNSTEQTIGRTVEAGINPTSVISAVFSEFNDRPIRIQMKFCGSPDQTLAGIDFQGAPPIPLHLEMEFDRVTLRATAFLLKSGKRFVVSPDKFSASYGEKATIYFESNEAAHYFDPRTLKFLEGPLFIPSTRTVSHANQLQNFNLSLGSHAMGMWKELKGSEESSSRKLAASVERELAQFFGYETVKLSTTNTDSDFLVEINNSRISLLRDMGNGFNQMVAVLLNLLMRNNRLVLIDEPEIGFHPKMQCAFIMMLGRFCDGPIVFATHSIGLARTTSEKIISFMNKNGQTLCRDFAESRHQLEMLGEMSFSSWNEIGCDGVLFVEGPHDVRVFSEWLRILGQRDSWAVLPLGGSTTINAAGVDAIVQVKKVHAKVAVVIDSELDSPNGLWQPKRRQFVEGCKQANLICYPTEWKATDNYLSDAAIKKVVGTNGKALLPFEKLANHGWGKRQSQKIAANMTREELLATDLGKFLNSLL